jgi:hypothetical protein
MPSVVVRFPDGSREFRFPARMLELDDVIWHDGARYRVVAVNQDDPDRPVVTVDPEPEGLGDLLNSERGAIELVPMN